MSLDPCLSRTDRIASFALGVFLLLTPFLNESVAHWRQIVFPATGLIFVIGAVGGT